MSFIQALLQHSFFQYALIGSFLASIAGGVVGSYVVIKRLAFISGAVAHSILGGIGLSVWLKASFSITWLSPLMGALIAGLISAWVLGWVHLNFKEREDSVIAAIWTIGMSLGILFLSLTPGPKVELSSFLIGNILWISAHDLWLLLALNTLILGVVFFFYHRLLALCFDEDQARLQKISVNVLYFVLLSLIATTIVLLMQVVGALLVITMLIIPATLSNRFTRFLPSMMGLAVVFNLVFSTLGLWVSFHLNWPAGASIALISAGSYLASIAFKSKKKRALTKADRDPLA